MRIYFGIQNKSAGVTDSENGQASGIWDLFLFGDTSPHGGRPSVDALASDSRVSDFGNSTSSCTYM